jgi:hypothetical protein
MTAGGNGDIMLSTTGSGDINIGSAANAGNVVATGDQLTLNSVGAIREFRTDSQIDADVLTAMAGGSIILGNNTLGQESAGFQPPNRIATLGDVTRGGEFYLYDSEGGLTVNGDIASHASDVTIRTFGILTLAASASLAAAGDGNDIVLSTEDNLLPITFFNNVDPGINPIITSGSGRFLIYARDRTRPPFTSALKIGGIQGQFFESGKTFVDLPPGSVGHPAQDGFIFSVATVSGAFGGESSKVVFQVIRVQDFRRISIAVADYDPSLFCDIGDICKSSFDLYEEERKRGKRVGEVPEKVEQPRFVVRPVAQGVR